MQALENNRRIQAQNNAPRDFPAFVRQGYDIKIMADGYDIDDKGLIYKVRGARDFTSIAEVTWQGAGGLLRTPEISLALTPAPTTWLAPPAIHDVLLMAWQHVAALHCPLPSGSPSISCGATGFLLRR